MTKKNKIIIMWRIGCEASTADVRRKRIVFFFFSMFKKYEKVVVQLLCGVYSTEKIYIIFFFLLCGMSAE